MDAYKLLASSLGIRPSRESNARIVRVERHDDGIWPKCNVKLIQLLRGHARLPHRIQVVINDLFASGDGLIRIGKNAMIGALAFIHVMGVVINLYFKFWHSFSFFKLGDRFSLLKVGMSTELKSEHCCGADIRSGGRS